MAKRRKRRQPEDVFSLAQALAKAKAAGCEVSVLNYRSPMHLRITGPQGGKVDFWPVSGTTWCVNSGHVPQKKQTFDYAVLLAADAKAAAEKLNRGVCVLSIGQARAMGETVKVSVEALTDQHPAHWRLKTASGAKVDYWPSSGTWTRVGTRKFHKERLTFERVLEIAREITSNPGSKPAPTPGR